MCERTREEHVLSLQGLEFLRLLLLPFPSSFLLLNFCEAHCTLTGGIEKCLQQAFPRFPDRSVSPVMMPSNQMREERSTKIEEES